MNTILATAASTSSDRVTFWISADGQSSIDMSGATAAEAVADLLAQAGTEAERAAILDGAFVAA